MSSFSVFSHPKYYSSVLIKTFITLVVTYALSGCSQPLRAPVESSKKEFEQVIDEQGYKVFSPIRDGDGAGSIITYINGQEVVVASKDLCFPELGEPQRQRIGFYNANTTSNIEGDIRTNLLSSSKVGNIIEGMISSDSSKSANLQLISPFRIRYESLSLKKQIRNLDVNDDCYKALFDSDSVLIIFDVIGAEGVRYSFGSDGGKKIRISAENSLHGDVSSQLERSIGSASELQVDGDILVGFRALSAEVLPGSSISELLVEIATIKDIESKIQKSIRREGRSGNSPRVIITSE